MVTQQEANDKAKQAVLKYDIKGAKAIAEQAVADNLDLVDLINNGFTAGINEVGELFAQKKLFLPHIMAAANALNAGMDVITPHLGSDAVSSRGKFVICTIEGDIHSIGKDICAIMLKVAGFDVNNLGRDVKLSEIVKACKEPGVVAVGTSALMTSTMVNQKSLEEMMKKEGLKGKVLTNVGGAPVTQQWADEIGADVYTETSTDIAPKMIAALNG